MEQTERKEREGEIGKETVKVGRKRKEKVTEG